MSQSKTISKVVSRFEIGFDDETKVVIDALKSKMDEVTRALSVKNDSHGDRLLVAMQAEAANDAPKPEILELGQWVFEGQDAKWVSASFDEDGQAVRWNVPKSELYRFEGTWMGGAGTCCEVIQGIFGGIGWHDSPIDRVSVNDVDYLSETVPEIQGMEASDIIIDEMGRDYSPNSNCLHAVVPQITQADMQLIFIKNLSECLIQRMHSMDRFSDDDHHVNGKKLMTWDILIYEPLGSFNILIADRRHSNTADLLVLWDTGAKVDGDWNTNSETFKTLRTITEAELPAFRAALEACYA